MARKKQYEASYAGYVYNKPATYWTPTTTVKQRLTKVDLDEPGTIEAGGIPLILDGTTAFVDTEDGHTLITASSGMKKTLATYLPAIRILAKAEENMVMTDPKGELFNRTAGFLRSQGYNVLCLDFRTMDKDCYNILRYPAVTYRSGDQEKGLAMLSDIVNTLAEDQRRNCKDQFWPDMGALWMNGTGAIMLDAFPDIEQINVLNWSDFNVRSSALLLENQILPEMPDGTTKSTLLQCCSSAENTFRSILVTASSFLAMFNQNPKLAAMLSHSTFTLEDLIAPKTAVFLVTDDTTSTADSILGIIISQFQTYLVDRAFHSPKGKLKTRVNFLLDEFASLPIPNMDKALATHRSRNIRYYLCVQSLALLKKRYGEPEALLANCSSTLFLGSTELELLQQLETKLGTTNITPDGSKRPLCTQAELMTLEKTWDYKEAIYMNLSQNIRYCTMLPSIEAYHLGDHPLPEYTTTPPAIQTYSVSRFASDILHRQLRAPFAPPLEPKASPSKSSRVSDSTSELINLISIDDWASGLFDSEGE